MTTAQAPDKGVKGGRSKTDPEKFTVATSHLKEESLLEPAVRGAVMERGGKAVTPGEVPAIFEAAKVERIYGGPRVRGRSSTSGTGVAATTQAAPTRQSAPRAPGVPTRSVIDAAASCNPANARPAKQQMSADESHETTGGREGSGRSRAAECEQEQVMGTSHKQSDVVTAGMLALGVALGDLAGSLASCDSRYTVVVAEV